MRRFLLFFLLLPMVTLYGDMRDDLMDALNHNNQMMIRQLLENGTDLEKKNDLGLSPLLEMVKSGNSEMVQLLLQYGVNINSIDNEGYTALHYAVRLGYQNIAKLLILNGAETNSINNSDETPVYISLKNNDIKMTELLIKHGGELDFIPTIDPIMKEYLTMRVNIRNKLYGLEFLNRTELMEAVFTGDYKLVEMLILDGAEVNEQNEMGLTALMMAAGLGNTYVTRLLLKKGADITLTDTDGLTALSYSMLINDSLVFNELMKKTETISSQALFYALFEKKKESLARLLESAETPDVCDHSGRSLLMYAAYLGDFFAVRRIIDNNGDVNKFDDAHMNPLKYGLLGMKEPDEDYYQVISELIKNNAWSDDLTHSDPEMEKALKGFR